MMKQVLERRADGVLVRAIAVAALVLGFVPAGLAGVPCLVDASGMPLRWAFGAAVFHPDPGPLSEEPGAAIDREQAVELVRAAAAVWERAQTAAIRFVAGASLPVDVGPANPEEFVGRCGDGISPIVFDPTGEVVEAAMGEGAADVVLGFTIHDCASEPGSVLSEATVVLNGAAFRNLGAVEGRRAFVGVIAHELGHFLNLCHSQLNADLADDGDPANDAYLPIMFPFRSDDDLESDPVLRFDDATMLSMLYPAPGFFSTGATIAGHILSGTAGRPVSGIGVTVRSTGDPLAIAQWTTSGWVRLEPANGRLVESSGAVAAIRGSYQASGLPPGSYTVEVAGGRRDAETEFFSGAIEGINPRTDAPRDAEPVSVVAGETNADVTVQLDRRVRSRLGETAWSIEWNGTANVAGIQAPLDQDSLPRGMLELLSTGRYRMAPAGELAGTWRPVGQRKYRLEIDPGAVQALLDPDGQVFHVRSVRARGRTSRELNTIEGRIRAHGIVLLPRARFSLRLDYEGSRVAGEPSPGRVPILSPSS
jgi:hypothetical protein